MRKAWIWRGFGALLCLGILAGYVPDLMLAANRRGARAEGLLDLPPAPKVAPQDDARPLYEAAGAKYPDAIPMLASDFVGQIKAPAPHTTKYLDAMAAASARPGYSPGPSRDDDSENVPLWLAAKALRARAKGEADLLAAARIARHVHAQDGLESSGRWANLVVSVLDRAAVLRLDAPARRRIAAAFGPPAAPREALHRHVAEAVAEFERQTRESGMSVNRTRAEANYLRFWRGFLRDLPPGGPTLVAALRRENDRLERAENDGWQYTDLSSLVGGAREPWAAWAESLERANARLGAVR